jgi:hypothetical protein
VTISGSWDAAPPNVTSETNKWQFAGNYKNDQTNAVPEGAMETSSDVDFANPDRLTNAEVKTTGGCPAESITRQIIKSIWTEESHSATVNM